MLYKSLNLFQNARTLCMRWTANLLLFINIRKQTLLPKTQTVFVSVPCPCQCPSTLAHVVKSECGTQQPCLQSAALIIADDKSHHLLEKESLSWLHKCILALSYPDQTLLQRLFLIIWQAHHFCPSSESYAWTAVVLTFKVFLSQLQPSYHVLSITE